MKKILLEKAKNTIRLDDIMGAVPIFVKGSTGKLIGMVVLENTKGWIVKLGGNLGATGYHETRKECVQSCLKLKYEFFIDE